MVIGCSSAVGTGDYLYLLWGKVLWTIENKLFQCLKNTLFYGTLCKSQAEKHGSDFHCTCYHTDHAIWKRFSISFS